MALPSPRLDDRHFQDLVDEAKRRVQRDCPEWTDHNVSDPGVVLIELFASMTEQILYRLNQVPDHLLRSFLTLVGVTPHPPRAAGASVTFWLSAAQPATVHVARGTAVATKRAPDRPAIGFTVVEALDIVPCTLVSVSTVGAAAAAVDRTAEATAGTAFPIFDEPPKAGDALHVELSAGVPGCAVAIRLECDQAYGHGVDPRRPPLQWEAFDGTEWQPADSDDGTVAFNRSGDAIVHVPKDISKVNTTRLRCRVTGDPVPAFRESPRVGGVSARTVGGSAWAVNGEPVEDERLGLATGQPSQRLTVQRPPIVGDEKLAVECRSRGGVDVYTEVESFVGCEQDDLVFTVDRAAGEIRFGPNLRDGEDDRPRQHGRVPEAGSELVVSRYLTGGGEQGNVARQELAVLKTTIPYVSRVSNRRAAVGGSAPESVEEATERGPLALRTRQRAVTPDDYEHFALAAADGVARVRCVPPEDPASPARVVVVPRLPEPTGQPVALARLEVDPEVKRVVREQLEARRVLGARFVVQDARYQGVRVDALVRVLPGFDEKEAEVRSVETLHRLFHPTHGGVDGRGWKFGRSAYSGMAYVALQRLNGIDIVQELKLYPVDLRTGDTGKDQQRIEIGPDAMVLSGEHRVAALPSEEQSA